jgi:thiopurine S-methyltransferase
MPEVKNSNAKDPQFWKNYWQTDCVRWQSPEVSPWLNELCFTYLKDLKDLTVYFPLCGKSVDMIWLAKNFGFKVMGSDCSAICC